MKRGFQEYLKEWKRLSPWFKAFAVVSVLMNAGAVVSISENIIKWRGFIRDSILIWHKLSAPVKEYLTEMISVPIDQYQIDYFVFQSIYSGIFFRLFLTHPALFLKNIKWPTSKREYIESFFSVVGFLFFTFPIWVFFYPQFIWGIGVFIGLQISLMWICFIPGIAEDEDQKKIIAMFYSYLFAIAFMVLILFSINLGLTGKIK